MIFQYLSRFNLKNRFNRDVTWYVTALFFLGFVGLANNVLLKKFRGDYGLGIFSIAYSVYLIVSQIAAGGVHLSVLKEVSYNQKNRYKCSEIYSSGLFLTSLFSISVAVIMYLTRNAVASFTKNPEDIAIALAILSPAVVFYSWNKVLLNVVNGLRMMRAYAIFQTLRIVFICIGIVIVIALGFEAPYVVIGLGFAEVLLLPILLIFLHRNSLAIMISQEVSKHFSYQLNFGFRALFSGIIYNINLRIDQLMLSHFFEADVVGIYTFASFFIEGINEVANAVRRNIDPILGHFFSKENIPAVNKVIKKIKHNFTPVMVVIFFAAILGFPALSIFVGYTPNFQKSWIVLIILMFGTFVSGRLRPFYWVLLQGGKPTAYTIVLIIAAILNISVNYLLIPLLGVYGAAIATSIVFIVQSYLIVIFAKKLLGVKI